MLRVGLCGTGDAGKHHARALVTLAAGGLLRWAGVVIRDPAEEAAVRAAIGAPEGVIAFPSLDALLGSGTCDAVILATPDGLHVEQVIAAARRGLHVLVEKPLALTRADGARAIDAARAANVALAVGYQLRHHAAHRLAFVNREALVGRLRSISLRWAWPDPATQGWRARGVDARFWSLAALGTHCLDLILMMTGADTVDEVVAIRMPPAGIDHAAEVSLRLGEVLAHVSVSIEHRAVSRLLITGDDGELEATGSLGARGDGELSHRLPRQAATPVAYVAEDPYVAQLRAFLYTAPAGFVEDPALLANLEILDRIHGDPS